MTPLLLFATLLACGPKSDLPVRTITVGEHAVKVEVAANAQHRARGLMDRDSLGADRGMLFIYPDEAPRSFWMKNTRIPLSIAYADRSGKIVKIADMQPHDTTSTPSLYPAKYALEMNQGWFEAHGIAKGAMLGDLPADEDVDVR